MQYFVTFFEGLLSFISPCVLPLLPVYVLYFAGGDSDDNASDKSSESSEGGSHLPERGRLKKVLANSLGFVLGFSICFCALGVLAGSFGGFLSRYKDVLGAVCGLFVVLFGLSYLGVFKLWFSGSKKSAVKVKSFWSALVLGLTYSVSLTPCVGAFLGSALALAANSGTMLKGLTLLALYSAGLGIPFVISSLLLEKLKGAFSFIKSHYKVINLICGFLLIIMGAFLVFRHSARIVQKASFQDFYNLQSDIVEEEDAIEIELTIDNFDKIITTSTLPVLVDFWASWCPPCKMLSPIISEIATEYNGKLKVGKVDVDSEQLLAARFNITSIPTLILFRNGKPEKIVYGYRPKSQLVKEFSLLF